MVQLNIIQIKRRKMYQNRSKVLLFVLLLFTALSAKSIDVTRVEPGQWWVGMKNTELQIMVYGPNIAQSTVTVSYPGIKLKEVAKVTNPNYAFLYLSIAKGTKPGNVPLTFTNGKEKFVHQYPIKARSDKTGALGFDASDVLYLIMPDRFANGNPQNDNLDSVMVNRRSPNGRHGGDLEGISNNLDYLQNLGVTTLWLNPIQENRMRGGSYHGYAITDFYKVDQRFGSNEEFKSLVKRL